MRLHDYLDKGASLGADAPCLSMGETRLDYAAAQAFSRAVAAALAAAGIGAGDHVAILSGNDPYAFAAVFGIARAGGVWCPINPRNTPAETAELLALFDCAALVFHPDFAGMVAAIVPGLAGLRLVACLGDAPGVAPSLAALVPDVAAAHPAPVTDVVMIAGTGGTTGRPKGVMLTDRNIETMTALTLAGYPFAGRPVYLAMAPLTHAAGVLAFPILALGGEIVILPHADIGGFLATIASARVTHSFLPPTLVYMLLDHPALDATDLSSLQCLWYGAAPISATRLAEALGRIGPVMAQLFGQTEAPMMISMMAPADHFDADGRIAVHRLASAGRPAPLVEVATMDADGRLLDCGDTGEIVIRSALVMKGYYKDEAATRATTTHGWHRTGDIGHVDADNFLYIVDRAKDMIITGGYNVYSAEVERALMQHPGIQDCAVFGLPDAKWGEQVAAVVQLRPGHSPSPQAILAAARAVLGGVKTPKRLDIWPDLPRSRVGKVLKREIRAAVLAEGDTVKPMDN